MTIRDALLQEPATGGRDVEKRAPRLLCWVGLILTLSIVALLAPFIGSTSLSFAAVFDFSNPINENIDQYIFVYTRMPRVLFGIIVGGGLALAGAVYQAILRNDLAEPFSLGVASGSAFGALLAFHIMPAYLEAFAMPVFAFGGAITSLATILAVARWKRGAPSPANIILAGVSMNFLFGAGILLLQYLSDPYQTVMLVRWSMGGLDITSWPTLAGLTILLLSSAIYLYRQTRNMDLLSFGEESAHHLGVNVSRVRFRSLFVASLLTACLVAFAGPIGFVGLIVPHAVRLTMGVRHGVVLPASLLGGALFLLICDTGARTVFPETEIPVGIITAILGGPMFLYLLSRKM